MTEVWARHPDFTSYEVSSEGRVRSYARRGVQTKPVAVPRLMKPVPDKDGYRRVQLKHWAGGYKRRGVHQLVAEVFLSRDRFEGAIVLHNNGDNADNRVENLRWGTYAENTADRAVHGTLGKTRSVEEIQEIKRLYEMGFHQREIARVFRTTQSYVHMLVTGKQRKDVA